MEARDRGAMYPILTDGDATSPRVRALTSFSSRMASFNPKRGVLEGVTRKAVLAAAEKLGYPM